jgi:hypothetical protein
MCRKRIDSVSGAGSGSGARAPVFMLAALTTACHVSAPIEPVPKASGAEANLPSKTPSSPALVPSPPTASLERLPPFTACPSGTFQVGGHPPVATERYCLVVEENRREGRYTRWYDNGLFAEEVDYVGGKVHGRYVSLSDTGESREAGNYVDGRRSGLWTGWQRGHLAFTGEFQSDLQHGHFAAWNRDTNTVEAVGQFRFGEPCGTFRCFDAVGRPSRCEKLDGKCPTTDTGGTCPVCDSIPPKAAPAPMSAVSSQPGETVDVAPQP